MSETSSSAPISNNRIPSGLIWAFGLVFLAALLALPFCIHRVMIMTGEQERGVTLVTLAGLPIDTRGLRAVVRESADKNTLAARYDLRPADAATLRDALAVIPTPDSAWLAELEKLSPDAPAWRPAPGSRGPWRAASGMKPDLAWRALLDEGSGVLWVIGSRR